MCGSDDRAPSCRVRDGARRHGPEAWESGFEVARIAQSSPAAGRAVAASCRRALRGMRARRRLNARGSVVSFRRSCADNWREAEGTMLRHVVVRRAGARGVFAGAAESGAWAKQSGRAVGTPGAGEPAEATGGLARRFTRWGRAARMTPWQSSESAAACRQLRAEQFFRRAGLRCPAGVRACSFYFLRALRGPFHKTKPAFARKTGSVSGSEPGTTKETSWPVRGR